MREHLGVFIRTDRDAPLTATPDPANLGTVLGVEFRLESAVRPTTAERRLAAARKLGSGWLARLRPRRR